MKRLFIFAAIIAATAMVACSPKKSNAELLIANQWHLDEIRYDGNDFTLSPPSNVTIIFSDSSDRIAGRGGCNGFFGVYKVSEDSKIDVNVGGSTLMACPDLEFEDTYFKLLEAVDTFAVTENELKLIVTAEGTTLVYKPEFKGVE